MKCAVVNRENRSNKTGFSLFEEGIIPKLTGKYGFQTIDYKFKHGARAITSEYIMGRKVHKEVKRNGYDRVFVPTHTQMMNINPEETDAEIIPYIHDTLVLTSSYYNFIFNIKGRLWSKNVKNCPKALTASNTTKKDLRNRIGFKNQAKTVYQGTGMKTPDPAPSYGERDIDLLYVGTLRERKNPEVIKKTAKICSKSSDLKMVAVNRTSLDIECEQKTSVSREKLRQLYQSTRYYLHPSHAEGFGRGPVEAQSQGAVPIANDIPINREILGQTSIYTTQPEKITLQVKSTEPSQWKELSNKSVQNSKRFSFEEAAQKISEYVKSN